jgi:predicted DNA-binding transcriptional regulator YafY
MRAGDFFRERTVRADASEALRILDEAGSEPPQPGDELDIGDADRVLRKAIQAKHLLRFFYKNKERVVEPHDYGIQKGIARLLSWQIGGKSTRKLPGWRWFDVANIQDFEVLGKSFAGNREVAGQHHKWDKIFIRVAPPEKRG